MALHGGLTFATNFFLHGGLVALDWKTCISLLIFGDNVEDDLGRWRYALLIAVSALVGDVCHVLGNLHGAHSMIPSIGASGGISGVIVFYALRFPHAQLGMMLRYGFYFRWIRFPAYVAMLFWFLLQLFYAFEEQMGHRQRGGPGASGRGSRRGGGLVFLAVRRDEGIHVERKLFRSRRLFLPAAEPYNRPGRRHRRFFQRKFLKQRMGRNSMQFNPVVRTLGGLWLLVASVAFANAAEPRSFHRGKI